MAFAAPSVAGDVLTDHNDIARAGAVLTETSLSTKSLLEGILSGCFRSSWMIAFNANTIAQKKVFCTTPNGEMGGIWQAGSRWQMATSIPIS